MSRPNFLFLFSDEHSYRCLSLLEGPAGRTGPDACSGRSGKTRRLLQRRLLPVSPLYTLPHLPADRAFTADRRRLGQWVLTSETGDPDNGLRLFRCRICHLPGRQDALGGRQPDGRFRAQTLWRSDRGAPDTRGIPCQYAKAASAMRSRTADAGLTEIPESALQEQIIVRESVTFLREQTAAEPDRPWFLCASFSRPHFPLTAPQRFLAKLLAGRRNAPPRLDVPATPPPTP